MAIFFGILFMAAAAVVGLTIGINYFWQAGWRQSSAYAALIVATVLLFGASGLWLNVSRHSWGVLAPVFALFLGAAWLCVKVAPPLWNAWKNFQTDKKKKR